MSPVGQFLQGETLVSELFVVFRETFFMTGREWENNTSYSAFKSLYHET